VVAPWRKVLGVDRTGNEGTRRLYQALAEASAAGQAQGKRLPADQVERRRRTSRELNLSQYLTPGYHGPRWTDEQEALLGTMPDEEVARRTGRTSNGVRLKREKLGIPNPCDRRRT
jgi:hypothetical protein